MSKIFSLNAVFNFVFWFLASLLVGSLLMGGQTVKAQNTVDEKSFPIVYPTTIISPSNTTYNSNFLTLNITALTVFDPRTLNITMVYCVDRKDNVTIPVAEIPEVKLVNITYANGTTETVQGEPPFVPDTIAGWVALPKLSEGSHALTVYAKYEYTNGYQEFIGLDTSSVYFTITDCAPPVISNLSLENKTYIRNELPLTFIIDESPSWIGYCLDGKTNVTIAGNTTLAGLTDGPHDLIVYANDTTGNMGTSITIHFDVSQLPSSSPSPSVPEFTVTTIMALAVAIGLAVLGTRKSIRQQASYKNV